MEVIEPVLTIKSLHHKNEDKNLKHESFVGLTFC